MTWQTLQCQDVLSHTDCASLCQPRDVLYCAMPCQTVPYWAALSQADCARPRMCHALPAPHHAMTYQSCAMPGPCHVLCQPHVIASPMPFQPCAMSASCLALCDVVLCHSSPGTCGSHAMLCHLQATPAPCRALPSLCSATPRPCQPHVVLCHFMLCCAGPMLCSPTLYHARPMPC